MVDVYTRTDDEVRQLLSEIGLERLIMVAHQQFTKLGCPEQTKLVFQAAINKTPSVAFKKGT
jgi:hypothetical protein